MTRLLRLASLLLCCVTALEAQSLTGAGGSFPSPLYTRWFSEYAQLHPGVHINYQPIGSGAGIRMVFDGVVDFGATDAPMTDAQMNAAPQPLLHVPTALGAVVPVFNLPGINGSVRFAPDVLADIFLGRLTRWNDPRLVRDNPGLSLPAREILPVYRADGSGSTYIFTDYLARVSPAFRSAVGRGLSVNWPVGAGQKGSEGVAGLVRGTPYALGYVEWVYASAGGLQSGEVRNAAGQWVTPSLESLSAAAQSALPPGSLDFRVSLVNAPGERSYPIASLTWLLIPEQTHPRATRQTLYGFLLWMLRQGETDAAMNGYAPLPPALSRSVESMVRQRLGNGPG